MSVLYFDGAELWALDLHRASAIDPSVPFWPAVSSIEPTGTCLQQSLKEDPEPGPREVGKTTLPEEVVAASALHDFA